MKSTNKALMLFIVLAGVLFAYDVSNAANGECFCDIFDESKAAEDPKQIQIDTSVGGTEELCVPTPESDPPFTLTNCKWKPYVGNTNGCCTVGKTEEDQATVISFLPQNSDYFCQQICKGTKAKEPTTLVTCVYSEVTTQLDCINEPTVYFGCCEYKEETTENVFLKYVYQSSESDCNDVCAKATGLVSECKFSGSETKIQCEEKKPVDLKPGATTLPPGELMGPPTPGAEETAPPTAPSGAPSAKLDIPDASVLNQLSSTDVKTAIGAAIKTVMGLMGSIALAMFVYGGVLWMSSAGNAERSKKGLQVILWASLGLFMIMASYVIVNFIFEAFKL